MQSTLILNASYEPLSVVSGRRAVALIMSGNATILEESPHELKSSANVHNIPYVIKMNYYINRKNHSKPASFSRKGVLARDRNTCAYCGKYASTIDHVIPKRDGGPSSYENCVAACFNCNRKKSHFSLAQVGYTLKHKPYSPSIYTHFLNKAAHDIEVFSIWSRYVFMYQPELAKTFIHISKA